MSLPYIKNHLISQNIQTLRYKIDFTYIYSFYTLQKKDTEENFRR